MGRDFYRFNKLGFAKRDETKPPLNGDGTAYDGNYWRYAADGVTPVIWKKQTAA